MTTKFDARQTVSRDSLDQLTPSTGQELDNLLRSINSRVTPPVKLEATSTPSLVVNVGSILVTNPETSKNHTIPPISGLLPVFTSGTVTADATGAGNITPSVGSAIALSMTASQFLRVGINLNSTGSLVLMKGLAAGSLAAATAPADVVGAFAIGYVVIRTDGSNNVANILNSDVYQYLGGGSGSGSGSGELNLIATGSSTATDWTAATGATAVTSITAGDLPLAGLISTALKITSGTGASTETTLAQTNSYAFTTPASYAVKTKVELWMRPGSNFINSEWTVSVYAGSTRQALTTDSSSFTYLPNANGKFTTYFDAAASTAYTVRLTRKLNAGTNAAVLNVTNVIVGPGIQPQGAVVGPWTSFTPTITNAGTTSLNTGQYRRVGDSMEMVVQAQFTSTGAGSTLSVALPTGFTLNTTAIPGYATDSVIVGATRYYNGTTVFITPATTNSSFSNAVIFGKSATSNSLLGTDFPSGTSLEFQVTVPIAEWAGSGTVNLAQNDVEYAYNTSTSDAADTTSFGYGPSGNTVVGALTSTRSKRVRFKSPIQVGDSLIVEVQASGGGQWNPVVSGDPSTGIGGLTFQTTAFTYGIGISTTYVNATDVDVSFGKYQYSSGATYASAGTAWSTSAANWRVRKISGGQAVGFGAFQAASSTNPAGISGLVPAAGLPGRTDGVAVPAGYVGEIVNSASLTAATLPLNAAADLGGGTLNLGPGSWEIVYNATITILSGITTSAPNFNEVNAGIFIATSGVEVDNSFRSMFHREVGVSAINAINQGVLTASAFVNISAVNTAYTLRGFYTSGGAGTGTASIENGGTTKSRFYAKRID